MIGFSRGFRAVSSTAMLFVGLAGAAGAEAPLPFEGTWVRADRACLPAAPSARTYSGRSLVTAGGRCTIRKIAFGAGEFEIFEDCRRTERPGNVVEKIRMMGADTLVLKFQTNRLKIPRGRRFIRCTAAAPKPAPAPTAPPAAGRPGLPPAAKPPASPALPAVHDQD